MLARFSKRTVFGGSNLNSVSSLARRGLSAPVQHVSVGLTAKEIVDHCKQYTMWSWSAQKAVDPIVMSRAEGIYFWDGDGKRYTDVNSQLMCSNIGHGHPKVIQAIKDQADKLCYAGPSMATEVRAELGPLLAAKTPGNLNKFFFTLGGSEANENAIKLARMHTGRHKIIARYKSYHGGTHASMMLTGDPRRWPSEMGGGMPGVVRAFDPYMYRSLLYRPGMSEEEFSALILKQLEEQIIYENPNNIAAMFLETVTGTNGLIPPPKGYLPGLRALLSKYGILMVCDEVMCGLGRTGDWFGATTYGVVPDIITMAKGITSAYLPLGAVAMTTEVAASFDEKPFAGGLTYMGHPLCLAAAVANLKVLEEEKVLENVRAVAPVLRARQEEMKAKHPCVGDIRGVGMFSCLELVKDRATKEPLAPYNSSSPAMAEIGKYLKEQGLYVFLAWNLVHVNPPLVTSAQQIDDIFAVIDKALDIGDKHYTGKR